MDAFLKEFIRNRSISFSVIPKMTSALENILGRVEEDMATNENMSRTFHNAKDANKYLDTL